LAFYNRLIDAFQKKKGSPMPKELPESDGDLKENIAFPLKTIVLLEIGQ